MFNVFLAQLLLTLTSLTVHARTPKLNAQDIQQLEKNQLVIKLEERENNPWPASTIYVLIKNVTPIEALAFYAAYHHQKNYVPNVLKSVPVKSVAPNDIHVEYEAHMPWPIPNSKYSTGNRIEKISADRYRVSWYQVWSENTDKLEGFAEFMPFKGQTLLHYYGFVAPKSFFAGLFKKIAPKRLQKTIQVIVDETQKIKQHNPGLLKKFVQLVQGQLAGQDVYRSMIQTENKNAAAQSAPKK